jgi:hypothetical protein
VVLTVTGWSPYQAPAVAALPVVTNTPALVRQDQMPLAPLMHPLAVVAAELETLPITRLRELAGVRSKRLRKCELVAVLAAC